MRFSPLTLYLLAAVFQAAGSSGAGMLTPFYMKAQGYSLALAGIPLFANGLGRVSSDLMSGVFASYFSPGVLITAATASGLIFSTLGIFFIDVSAAFFSIWVMLGLTEALFALSIRKIAFDQSAPERQGRVQGQVATALGIGFTLGPLLGGIVGKSFGTGSLFVLYAIPQLIGLILILLGGAHRQRQVTGEGSHLIWREGRKLLSNSAFLSSCLAVFQSFLFLTGVTKVAFPFLAVNARGFGLDVVGTMVAISRMTDTFGRYSGGWLCDRIKTRRVILLGVGIGIPLFLVQTYGVQYATLLVPLTILTFGFGLSNVGCTTFGLQVADQQARGLSLGLTRAATSLGNMLGPLFAGALVEGLGYELSFQTMAIFSFAVLVIAWCGLRNGSN